MNTAVNNYEGHSKGSWPGRGYNECFQHGQCLVLKMLGTDILW